MQSGQSYGQSLPDQVERIGALFDVHLELIGEVRELYTSRVALEREYAATLQTLSRKAGEKKYKMEAALAVGDHPTKTWDSTKLMQNSLVAAYTELTESMSSTAQDHINVADCLSSQVIDVLKAVEKKNEDSIRTEIQFFQKLLGDRDRLYSERLKVRAQDDKHADRAAKQAEQQRNEMLSGKNAYLISIAIANSAKAQFYESSLPALEDQIRMCIDSVKIRRDIMMMDVLEQLQRRLIERFAKILRHSQSLQLSHLDSLKSRVSQVDAAFSRVDAVKDQDIFIDHNIRPFSAPDDWVFEPCITHYDTPEISVDPAPKIVLQNKLSRCRSKLHELLPLVDTKQTELNQLSNQVSAYKADHVLGSIDELTQSLLDLQHQVALYSSSERLLQAEIDVITGAIGATPLLQKLVVLDPYTMRVLQANDLGAEQARKNLQALRHLCARKMRAQADCELADAKSTSQVGSRLSRSGSRVSTIQTSRASSFLPSIASDESTEEDHQTARVIYDFEPSSEFELRVSEGDIINIVEGDDGSGWVKVTNLQGKSGLVPATYLAHGDSAAPSSVQPSQGSGKHVRVLYDYAAQGPDELPLTEGQTIELTSGQSGGQNYGDGWWEDSRTVDV
ncbi:hypothetical protein H0H93_009376 [Arthromyces matolae]|nr:hypothetical protein H0H93_009376 [Arthromyces matolae]